MLPKHFYENEKRLAAFALLHSITGIHVDFNGAGDSGSIDDVTIQAPEGFDQKTPITVFKEGVRTFDEDEGWGTGPVEEYAIAFEDFLHSHVEAALDETGIDWYNNEGGFGEWVWDPRKGVNFEVNVRIEESECLHQEEGRPLGAPEEETETEASEQEGA